jgi:ADP-ribose pyrophosphatase
MKKTIFKGKLLELSVEKKRLPNGYLATFETIKHPGAALIIPFLAKDRIIMLRQLRPVIKSYIYELPAGTLGKGESAISCARRETVEETGYAARKFTLLGRIYPVPGYSTERISVYKAEGLKKAARAAEKDEVMKTHIFDKKTARRFFKNGRITDAKTICGLALCGWI